MWYAVLTLTSQVMGSVTSCIAVIRRHPARNSPVVSWKRVVISNDLNTFWLLDSNLVMQPKNKVICAILPNLQKRFLVVFLWINRITLNKLFNPPNKVTKDIILRPSYFLIFFFKRPVVVESEFSMKSQDLVSNSRNIFVWISTKCLSEAGQAVHSRTRFEGT